MLKNYLMITWKIFLRRKFFTFINLFGICITLTIIIVTARIVDNNLYPIGPEKNNENFLIISRLTQTNDDESSTTSNRPGYKFMSDYVLPLKAPEIISIYTNSRNISSYIKGKKVKHGLRRTDANYWKVLQFEFIQGQPFDQEQFEKGRTVAVINEHTASLYFANASSAIGEYIEVQNLRFQVIGVVKNVTRTEIDAYSDIWVPFTTLPSTAYRYQMTGNFKAILYHSDPSLLKDVRLEFINRLKNEFVSDDDMTKAYSHADSKLEELARDIFGQKTSFDDYTQTLFIFSSVLILFFMLLPSINMINLNISRIMERSSEIGVRKAFGASTAQLVWQFIVESILLTTIGGLMAFLLSSFVLNTIEISGIIPYVEFNSNLRVFSVSILLILVFALVSGVYPAFKMARLPPVVALKGGW